MADAVLYARFSPGSNSATSQSAEAQLAQCRGYCDFHKLEVIGAFADEGISGRSVGNRPGFVQALEMACQKKAVLVVYSLSRFARSTKDAIEYAERLDKAGANLASLKEQLDTTTPVGRFTFRILAALAELEREQIAERTRDAMLYYQSQNRRMSDRLPFGWQGDPTNDTMMIEDPAEQSIIARVISLRKQSLSLRKIARILWMEGIEGRRYPIYERIPKGKRGKMVKTDKVVARSTCWFHHSLLGSILKRAGAE